MTFMLLHSNINNYALFCFVFFLTNDFTSEGLRRTISSIFPTKYYFFKVMRHTFKNYINRIIKNTLNLDWRFIQNEHKREVKQNVLQKIKREKNIKKYGSLYIICYISFMCMLTATWKCSFYLQTFENTKYRFLLLGILVFLYSDKNNGRISDSTK